MADVKSLTDVELTELWLSKVVGYKKTPGAEDIIRAIDYEMRERGQERVRTAWHAVAAKREAAKTSLAEETREERIAYSEWVWSGDEEVAP